MVFLQFIILKYAAGKLSSIVCGKFNVAYDVGERVVRKYEQAQLA